MEQSKTLQNVMIRARGEALRLHAAAPAEEHVYLSLLKVSTLTSEKIAPSSSERASIDEEIKKINEILKSAGIDAEATEEVLRSELASVPAGSAATANARILELFGRAAHYAKDKLTAPAVLKALLENPTDAILRANGGVLPAPPKPPKRDEQGRGEFWASGNSSVHGPGSQSSQGGTDSNAGAGKFVMPSMPDPGEFNAAAVTVFDLPDEPKVAPKAKISVELPPQKQEGDSNVEPEDDGLPDEQPPEPPKPEEPKKGGSDGKREGVDLAAIMLELREKRARGGGATASEGDGGVTPKKPEPHSEPKPQPKPEPKPELKPEPRPEPKPEPVPEIKPDIPKPREGVDLAGIMRELREKRIREQKEKSDKPDDDGGDAEPDRGGAKFGLREAQLSFEASDEISDMPESGSGQKKKTTVFLGKTYQTGLLGAILIYLLVVGLIQTVIISALNAALKSPRLEADTAVFVSALLLIDLVILAYSILRILPGLFERRFTPFSYYLDYLLFVGLMLAIVEVLVLIFDVPNWLAVTMKIIGGILAIVQGARVQERIFELPNTRGIARKVEFWGINTFGSPDKILFQAILSLGYTPIVLLTVYWCLKRPIDPAAAIVLFLLGYSALYAIPKSMALWYQKEDSLCTKKDEKKGAAASVYKVELIVLATPAFLLFLSKLYNWNPVSAWMIVVYCVFGLIDVVATIGAIAVNKPD